MFDEAAYRRDLHGSKAASRAYIILFSARTGSSWLTEALSATGTLGTPEEFLNADFIVDLARATNAATPNRLLHMLRRLRKTPNGVFGLEARHLDIEALGIEPFRAAFAQQAVFFHLWREDIVAQAVSLYRAVTTERFHSSSQAGSAEPPPYDAAQIGRWLAHIAATENGNVRLLQALGTPARQLRYEPMVADRAGTVAAIARVMGVELTDVAVAPGLERLADAWNSEAVARFRAEQAEQVAATEAARLVRHGIATKPRPHPAAAEPRAIWELGHAAGARGDSPYDPPHAPTTEAGRIWRDGWNDGWDDAPLLSEPTVPAAPAALVESALPPDLPDAVSKLGPRRAPRPLADLTGRLLAELLVDQERRSVPGGMLEIGLSRGAQTGILLCAAHRGGTRVGGIDASDGQLCEALDGWLARTTGPARACWTVRTGLPETDAAGWALTALGGPARCVCVDAAQFAVPASTLLALAVQVLGEDSCLVVSDFLSSSALDTTESVFRLLGADPRLEPFAILPGRLLLAPTPVAPRYRDMIKALALRDASRTGAGRLAAALRHGRIGHLAQKLCGSEVLVLG